MSALDTQIRGVWPDEIPPAETRCRCRPHGFQCVAVMSQEDMLCDRCRRGEPFINGEHWCDYSQTPEFPAARTQTRRGDKG